MEEAVPVPFDPILFLKDDQQFLSLANSLVDEEYFNRLGLDRLERYQWVEKHSGYHAIKGLLLRAQPYALSTDNVNTLSERTLHNLTFTVCLDGITSELKALKSKNYGSSLCFRLWQNCNFINNLKKEVEESCKIRAIPIVKMIVNSYYTDSYKSLSVESLSLKHFVDADRLIHTGKDPKEYLFI